MKEKLRSMVGMLTSMFILGMLENLIGAPESDMSQFHNIVAGIILLLHVVLGIGLLVTATQIIRRPETAQSEVLKKSAGRGFGALVVAFLAGVVTMSGFWPEFFSFLMAVGFIAALLSYGQALMSLGSASVHAKSKQ